MGEQGPTLRQLRDNQERVLELVRMTATQFAHARQRRDDAIHHAREMGVSLRRIQEASDLSKDTVKAILKRK